MRLIPKAGLSAAVSLLAALSACAPTEAPATRTLRERLTLPDAGSPWTVEGRTGGSPFVVSFPGGGSELDRLPPALAGQLRQLASYRDGNIVEATNAADSVDALLDRTKLTQPPEYTQTLSEVVFSVHPSDGELDDPLHRHAPLLAALPAASRIYMFTPAELTADVQRSLEAQGLRERTTVWPVPTWVREEGGVRLVHAVTRWAQDLAEVTQGADGKPRILAPLSRYQINDLTRADNLYLSEMATHGYGVTRVPLFFRGGNVLIGEIPGEGAADPTRVALVGTRELENNRNDAYNSLFVRPPVSAVTDLLARLVGVDAVHTLPNSRNLFHLDMAMSVVGPGKAAVLYPLDADAVSPEDQRVLSALEEALPPLGFEIVRIPTLSTRISAFQSSANIVPFTDAKTGTVRALVPWFEDVEVVQDGATRSLNRLVEEAYRAAGIEPIMVEDRFHPVNGNLHCATLVLR